MRGTAVAARAAQLARRRRPVSRLELTELVRALRGPHRVSACRAVVDGAFVTVTLQRRGLRPLLHRPRPDGRARPDVAREVAAAVDAGMGVLPVKATCLRRSMTLLRELERKGLSGDLHLGVRADPGGIGAHAWIEVAGVVVNDDPDEVRTYARLAAGDVERFMPTFR